MDRFPALPPLSRSEATMEALPLSLKVIVMFLQSAIGVMDASTAVKLMLSIAISLVLPFPLVPTNRNLT